MFESPTFGLAVAHHHFSAHCFNQCWALLESPSRSDNDDEQMLLLAHTSLWHWTQREDCAPKNLAIAFWLLARVTAILGRQEAASTYAEQSLLHAEDTGPFLRGYGFEALARAAQLSGHRERAAEFLRKAFTLAQEVKEESERRKLLKDLQELDAFQNP